MQVDLRPVERAVALVDRRTRCRAARAPRSAPSVKSHSSSVPSLLSGRVELEARLHPEQVVEVRRVVEAAEDLVLDLLRRAEDVRVVLRDVPHAQQPVQRPGELVAVQRRRLGVAERQLAVAAQPAAEEAACARGSSSASGRTSAPRRRGRGTCSRGTSPSGPRSPRARRRRSAASSPRRSRAARSRGGAGPRARSRSPSPSGARTASRASARRGGRGRAAGRAGGGRGASPPRAARGARRGPPASRTRCRRSASAACSSRRRASTRRRGR